MTDSSYSRRLRGSQHKAAYLVRGKPPVRGKPLARCKPQPRSRRPGDRLTTSKLLLVEGRMIMDTVKRNYHKIAALIIAAFMLLSVFAGAIPAKAAEASDPAVIDTGKTGSITVTKYTSSETNPSKGNATGTTDDETGIDNSYTPLAGATFKLFKIADAVVTYYNGTDENTYDLSKFNYDGTNATYNGYPIATSDMYEGTTDENGKCKFANLPVGIYVLKEVTAPAQITTPLAEDSLISIPMVNTDTSSNNENAKWIYDINVYPKNHDSTGTLELIKTNQDGTLLSGVTFELYKKELEENGTIVQGEWVKVENTISNTGTSVPLDMKTGAYGKMTLAGLPSGLYGTQYKLVEVYTGGTSPEGYIINSNPMYFKMNNDNTITWNPAAVDINNCNNINTGVKGTPAADAATPNKLSVSLVNEIPSLSKMVQENDGTDWKTDEQYRLDDEITYKLTVKVPANVAELNTFEIKDTPDAGITDEAVKSVKHGDTADACNTVITEDGYTFTTVPAESGKGQGFTFTLNNSVKDNVAGKYLEIIYTAHMNENAEIAGNGNGNTATLTYSKFIGNTTDTTSVYTITDEARVYTYQYQITKYKDSVSDTNKIAGVEFNLLYNQNGDAVSVVDKGNGVYRLALQSDTEKTTVLKTYNDGTITIQGLENGNYYYLKETKTIANYNLLSKPVNITVNVTETTTWNEETAFDTATKSVKSFNKVDYNVSYAKGTSTVVNKKGFTLPKTGSMGFILFCVLGLALIAGGAMLIFGGKRTKKIR